jgi:ABC-type lipoprotein release transport system permease subunit
MNMIDMLLIILKNAIRHRRDSLLIGIMIGFAAAVLNLASALEKGMIQQMTNRIINIDTGHLLIQSDSLIGDGSNEISGRKINWSAFIDLDGPWYQFLNRHNDIERVGGRLLFSGMFYSRTKSSRAFKILGIEPQKEKIASELTMGRGSFLGNNDIHGIVMHEDMASALALQVGDNLTVMCLTKGGGINALDFTLCGTFTNCAPWQVINSYIHLKAAQTLLNVGNRAMQLVVFLKNPDQLNHFNIPLGPAANHRDQVKVLTWQQAGKFYLNQIQGVQSMITMIYILLYLSIFGIIMNYMVMIVQRRVHEIGILKAVGTSPRQLLVIYLGELVFITLVWILAGLLISWLVFLWLKGVGVMTSGALSFLIGGRQLFPVWNWKQVYTASFFFVAVAGLAGFFPLRKANKIEVTRALQVTL